MNFLLLKSFVEIPFTLWYREGFIFRIGKGRYAIPIDQRLDVGGPKGGVGAIAHEVEVAVKLKAELYPSFMDDGRPYLRLRHRGHVRQKPRRHRTVSVQGAVVQVAFPCSLSNLIKGNNRLGCLTQLI